MAFRNILAAIDGSPHGARALAEAVELARAYNASLTVMTSVPDPSVWMVTGGAYGGQLNYEALVAGGEREYSELLEHAVEEVPDDLPVTKIITHDPIRPALMKEIKSGRHDLVVMGSRGRGAVASSVLGSVSHHALNHSPVPVLIVHAREPQAGTDEPNPAVAAHER